MTDFLSYLTHMYQSPDWNRSPDGDAANLAQSNAGFVQNYTPQQIQFNPEDTTQFSQQFRSQTHSENSDLRALGSLFSQFQTERDQTTSRINTLRSMNPDQKVQFIDQVLTRNDRVLGIAFIRLESILRSGNSAELPRALEQYNAVLHNYIEDHRLMDQNGADRVPEDTIKDVYDLALQPTLALMSLLNSRLSQADHNNPEISAALRRSTEQIQNAWNLIASTIPATPAAQAYEGDARNFAFLREFALGQSDLLQMALNEDTNQASQNPQILVSARNHLQAAQSQSRGVVNTLHPATDSDLEYFTSIVASTAPRHINDFANLPVATQAARYLITANTLSFVSTIFREMDLANRTEADVVSTRYTRFQSVLSSLIAVQSQIAVQPQHDLRQTMNSLQNLRWDDELYNHVQNWISTRNHLPANANSQINLETVIASLENDTANPALRQEAITNIEGFVRINAHNPAHQDIDVRNLTHRTNGALTLLKGSQTLHAMMPILARHLQETLRGMPANSPDRINLLNVFRTNAENTRDTERTNLEVGKREIIAALLRNETPSEEALTRFKASGHEAREFVNHLIEFIRDRSPEQNHLQENLRRAQQVSVHPAITGARDLNNSLQAIAMNQVPPANIPAGLSRAPAWLTGLQSAQYTEPTRHTPEENNQQIIQNLGELANDLEHGRIMNERDTVANYNRLYSDLIYFVEAAGANGGIKNTDQSHRDSDLEHVQRILGGHGLFADSHDLIDELLTLDSNALQGSNANSQLGNLANHWAEGVLRVLNAHEFNVTENFIHDNERHPSSFRAIWNTLGGRANEEGSLASQLASLHLENSELASSVQNTARERFNASHPIREVLLSFGTAENLALNAVMAGSAQWANRSIQGSEAVANGGRVALSEYLLQSAQQMNRHPLRWITHNAGRLTGALSRNPTMTAFGVSAITGYQVANLRDQANNNYNHEHPDDPRTFNFYEDWARNTAGLFAVAAPLWYPSYFSSMRNAQLPGFKQTQWRVFAPYTWSPYTRVGATLFASGVGAMVTDRFRNTHSHYENYAYGALGTFAVLSPFAFSASGRLTQMIENYGVRISENSFLGTVAERGQLGFAGHMLVGGSSGLAGGAFSSGLTALRNSANGADTHFWSDLRQSGTTLGVAMAINSGAGALFNVPGRLAQRWRERGMTPQQVQEARLLQAQEEVQTIINRGAMANRGIGATRALGSALVATSGMFATDAEMRALQDNRFIPQRSDWHLNAEGAQEFATTYLNMLAFEGMNAGMNQFRMKNLLGRPRSVQIDHLVNRFTQDVTFGNPAERTATRQFLWNRLALESLRGRDLSQIAREDNVRQWQANYQNGVATLNNRGAGNHTSIPDTQHVGASLTELFSQAQIYSGENTPPPVTLYINKTDGSIRREAPLETERSDYESVNVGFSGGRVFLADEPNNPLSAQRQLQRMIAEGTDNPSHSTPPSVEQISVATTAREILAHHGAPVEIAPVATLMTGIISGIRQERLEAPVSLFVTETDPANQNLTSPRAIEEAMHREHGKTSPDQSVLRHLNEQLGLFRNRQLLSRVEVNGTHYDIYRGTEQIIPENRRSRIAFEMTIPGTRNPNPTIRPGMAGLYDRWRSQENTELVSIRTRRGDGTWSSIPDGWRELLARYNNPRQAILGQPVQLSGQVIGSTAVIAAPPLKETARVFHVGDSHRISVSSFNSPFEAWLPNGLEIAIERRGENEWYLHNYSTEDSIHIEVGGVAVTRNNPRVINAGDVLRIPAGQGSDGTPRFIEINLDLDNGATRRRGSGGGATHAAPATHATSPSIHQFTGFAVQRIRDAVITIHPTKANTILVNTGERPVRSGNVEISAHSSDVEVEIQPGTEHNISVEGASPTDIEGIRIVNPAGVRAAPNNHLSTPTRIIQVSSLPFSEGPVRIEARTEPYTRRVGTRHFTISANSSSNLLLNDRSTLPANGRSNLQMNEASHADISYTDTDGHVVTLRIEYSRATRPAPTAHASTVDAANVHSLNNLRTAPLRLEGIVIEARPGGVRIITNDTAALVESTTVTAGQSHDVDLTPGSYLDVSYTKADGSSETILIECPAFEAPHAHAASPSTIRNLADLPTSPTRENIGPATIERNATGIIIHTGSTGGVRLTDGERIPPNETRNISIDAGNHLDISYQADATGRVETVRIQNNARPARVAPDAHLATPTRNITWSELDRTHNISGMGIEAGSQANHILITNPGAEVRVGSSVLLPNASGHEVEVLPGSSVDVSIRKADGSTITARITNPRPRTPTIPPPAFSSSVSASGIPLILHQQGDAIVQSATHQVQISFGPTSARRVYLLPSINDGETITLTHNEAPELITHADSRLHIKREGDEYRITIEDREQTSDVTDEAIANMSYNVGRTGFRIEVPRSPVPQASTLPAPEPSDPFADWGTDPVTATSSPAAPRVSLRDSLVGDPTAVIGHIGHTARAVTNFHTGIPRDGGARFALYEIILNPQGHVAEIRTLAEGVAGDSTLLPNQMLMRIGIAEPVVVRRANIHGIAPESRDFMDQAFVVDRSEPKPTAKIDPEVMDRVGRALNTLEALGNLIHSGLANGNYAIVATSDRANPYRLENIAAGTYPAQFAALVDIQTDRVSVRHNLSQGNDTRDNIMRAINDAFRGRTIVESHFDVPPLPPGGPGGGGGNFPVDPTAVDLGRTNAAAMPASIATHSSLHIGVNNLIGEVPLSQFYPGENDLPPIVFSVEHHASGSYLRVRSVDGNGQVSFRHPLSTEANPVRVGQNWVDMGRADPRSSIRFNFTNGRGEAQEIRITIENSITEARTSTPPPALPAGMQTFEFTQGERRTLADVLGITEPNSQLHNVHLRLANTGAEMYYLDTGDNVHRIECGRGSAVPVHLRENTSGILFGSPGENVTIRAQDAYGHFETYQVQVPRPREASPAPVARESLVEACRNMTPEDFTAALRNSGDPFVGAEPSRVSDTRPTLLTASDVGLLAPSQLRNLAADATLYAGRVEIVPLAQEFSIAEGETIELYSARGDALANLAAEAFALPSSHRAHIVRTMAYGQAGLNRVGTVRREGNQLHLSIADSQNLGQRGGLRTGNEVLLSEGDEIVNGDHSFRFQNGKLTLASTEVHVIPGNERSVLWNPMRSDDSAPLPLAIGVTVGSRTAAEYHDFYQGLPGHTLDSDTCAQIEAGARSFASIDFVFDRQSGALIARNSYGLSDRASAPLTENPNHVRIRGIYSSGPHEIEFTDLPGSNGRASLNLDTGRFRYEVTSANLDAAVTARNSIQALVTSSTDTQLHFFINSYNGELRTRENPETRQRWHYVEVQIEQDPATHAIRKIQYRIVGSGEALQDLTRTSALPATLDSDALEILQSLQTFAPEADITTPTAPTEWFRAPGGGPSRISSSGATTQANYDALRAQRFPTPSIYNDRGELHTVPLSQVGTSISFAGTQARIVMGVQSSGADGSLHPIYYLHDGHLAPVLNADNTPIPNQSRTQASLRGTWLHRTNNILYRVGSNAREHDGIIDLRHGDRIFFGPPENHFGFFDWIAPGENPATLVRRPDPREELDNSLLVEVVPEASPAAPAPEALVPVAPEASLPPTRVRNDAREIRLPVTANMGLNRGTHDSLQNLLRAQGFSIPDDSFLAQISVGRNLRDNNQVYLFRNDGNSTFTLTRQRALPGQNVSYGNDAENYSGFRHVLGEVGETVILHSGEEAYTLTLQAPESRPARTSPETPWTRLRQNIRFPGLFNSLANWVGTELGLPDPWYRAPTSSTTSSPSAGRVRRDARMAMPIVPVAPAAEITHPVPNQVALVFRPGTNAGEEVCTVGRRTSSNPDVVNLGASNISRQQARIIRSNGRYSIEDLSAPQASGSFTSDTHGTYVYHPSHGWQRAEGNGRLDLQPSTPTQLGSVIALGNPPSRLAGNNEPIDLNYYVLSPEGSLQTIDPNLNLFPRPYQPVRIQFIGNQQWVMMDHSRSEAEVGRNFQAQLFPLPQISRNLFSLGVGPEVKGGTISYPTAMLTWKSNNNARILGLLRDGRTEAILNTNDEVSLLPGSRYHIELGDGAGNFNNTNPIIVEVPTAGGRLPPPASQ